MSTRCDKPLADPRVLNCRCHRPINHAGAHYCDHGFAWEEQAVSTERRYPTEEDSRDKLIERRQSASCGFRWNDGGDVHLCEWTQGHEGDHRCGYCGKKKARAP